MTESCPRCKHEAVVIIEPSKPDAINWRAKCPICSTNFFGVFFPKQATVVRLEGEDSPIQ